MRPQTRDIAVPPFAPATEWIGEPPGPVERICARGPLLVELIDAAHVSSVRTLPYLRAWDRRYGDLGLAVVAVNSPRFPFTGKAAKLGAALARLEVGFPVAVDAGYEIWHDYGSEGWPSLFLWGRGGALRWFHFGEGEYEGTEEAIRDELRAADPDAELPAPVGAIRPSDVAGALVARPTEEIFPGGSTSEPWRPGDREPPLELEYQAGGAWATVDGTGTLTVSLDGRPRATIAIEAPGAYELAAHERHEAHRLSLSASPGLSVYAVGFSAGLPPTER